MNGILLDSFPFALIVSVIMVCHFSLTLSFCCAWSLFPTPASPDGIKSFRLHLAKLRQRGSEEILKGAVARLYPLDERPE